MTVENLYRAPEASLIDETSKEDSPTYQLYRPGAIALATFIGTVLAGGYLMAQNYKSLGQEAAARKAMIWSFVATVAIFAISALIPETWNVPNLVFVVPQIVVMLQLIKQLQGAAIAEHCEQGGAMASNWKAFGISLLFMIGVGVVLIAAVLVYVYMTTGTL